jgi:hypothetical protein
MSEQQTQVPPVWERRELLSKTNCDSDVAPKTIARATPEEYSGHLLTKAENTEGKHATKLTRP